VVALGPSDCGHRCRPRSPQKVNGQCLRRGFASYAGRFV
jgi:hypothetical protein